ncbi:DUF6303 family protein [Kitasatospora sp. NPDC098663]|uniref:DUF6303 family protein n=1 Tax=Kitasatospora sp. NPDC098663 TaxID=3364096 RepID=UPI00382AA899
MTTYRATFAQGQHGTWHLFVALPGNVADWPTEEFGTKTIPTVEARAEALGVLGYETTAPAGAIVWDWHEDVADDGQVMLLAGTNVRPVKY